MVVHLAVLGLSASALALPAELTAAQQSSTSDQWDLFFTSDVEIDGFSIHLIGATSFDYYTQPEGGVVDPSFSFVLPRSTLEAVSGVADESGNIGVLAFPGDLIFLDIQSGLAAPFTPGSGVLLGTATATTTAADGLSIALDGFPVGGAARARTGEREPPRRRQPAIRRHRVRASGRRPDLRAATHARSPGIGRQPDPRAGVPAPFRGRPGHRGGIRATEARPLAL